MLKRWADKRLRDQINQLQGELEAKDRMIMVQAVEIQQLAAVAARDRARVEAEAAVYAANRAAAEGAKRA